MSNQFPIISWSSLLRDRHALEGVGLEWACCLADAGDDWKAAALSNCSQEGSGEAGYWCHCELSLFFERRAFCSWEERVEMWSWVWLSFLLSFLMYLVLYGMNEGKLQEQETLWNIYTYQTDGTIPTIKNSPGRWRAAPDFSLIVARYYNSIVP